MLDWNDLRTFAEVARTGSVAAAARAMRLHPTTVARRIAAAEAALGTALFLRSGRRSMPSATGQSLLAPLAPLVDAVDDVARRASRHQDAPLRVALTENGARFFCTRVVPLLDREGIEVEVVAGNAVLDLSRGDADLAIRVVQPEEPQLVRRRIGTVVYGLFAAKSYLKRAPDFAEGWPGHTLLMPSGELARGPEAAFLAEHGGKARVAVRANSHIALAHGAEGGLGLVVLPTNLAVFHAGLVRVRLLPEIPGRSIWLVTHRSLRGNARVKRASVIAADAFKAAERELAAS